MVFFLSYDFERKAPRPGRAFPELRRWRRVSATERMSQQVDADSLTPTARSCNRLIARVQSTQPNSASCGLPAMRSGAACLPASHSHRGASLARHATIVTAAETAASAAAHHAGRFAAGGNLIAPTARSRLDYSAPTRRGSSPAGSRPDKMGPMGSAPAHVYSQSRRGRS